MITVSIAEDLPEIRAGVEKIISEQPDMLLLSSSRNAIEAMPLIVEKQPDVVIMDINMPLMNGVEATKEIRRLSLRGNLDLSNTKVFMHSAI